MNITFFVPGRPKAKARGRAKARKNGKPFVYPEGKTKSYENYVGLLCNQAMRGREPLKGALRMEVEFHFAVPKSWTKKQKAMVPFHHAATPDLTNLIKAIEDGMNSIAWKDDAQIAEMGNPKKIYSNDAEGAYISVSEIENG